MKQPKKTIVKQATIDGEAIQDTATTVVSSNDSNDATDAPTKQSRIQRARGYFKRMFRKTSKN